jgi:HlyD family secretion protein
VTLDAFKGQRLGCEVLRISPVASERDWRSDIRKFEVILALEKNDLPLKPGATVKAEVLVGEVKDVLAVPLQAVYVKEGKYFCFVDAGGRPGRREVKLGESNASSVAVVDGLKEGDEVLLYNPEGGADGAPAGEKEKRKDGPAAPAAAPAANGGGSGAGGGAGRGGKP